MTDTIIFDFDRIATVKDFYTVAAKKLLLPEYFGNNLDALWDSLTGDIDLPVHIEFINLTLNKLETFEDVISVFEEAAVELGEDFLFSYSLGV